MNTNIGKGLVIIGAFVLGIGVGYIYKSRVSNPEPYRYYSLPSLQQFDNLIRNGKYANMKNKWEEFVNTVPTAINFSYSSKDYYRPYYTQYGIPTEKYYYHISGFCQKHYSCSSWKPTHCKISDLLKFPNLHSNLLIKIHNAYVEFLERE